MTLLSRLYGSFVEIFLYVNGEDSRRINFALHPTWYRALLSRLYGSFVTIIWLVCRDFLYLNFALHPMWYRALLSRLHGSFVTSICSPRMVRAQMCLHHKYYRALSLKNIELLCSKYGPLLSRLNRNRIVRAADVSNALCIPKNIGLFRHKYRSLSHKYRALLPRLIGTRMVRAVDVSCSLCIPENVGLFRHEYRALSHEYGALLPGILRTWMVRAADVSCSLCIPNSTSIPSSK